MQVKKQVSIAESSNMASVVEITSRVADLKVVDEGMLSKDTRTTSFQSTAPPSGISSAASVCSAPPQSEPSSSTAICAWQDAIWTTDIPARGPELEANPQWSEWVKQVVECSELAFENNCLEMISKRSKFKLAILSAPTGEFLGFSVYKVNRGAGNLTIGKIAVSEAHRGHGYGKRMVKETIKMGKKDKMIYFVSLSALPTAVKFYKRLNFKEFKDVKFTEVDIEEGESFVEGQMYMEFKVRNAPRKKK